MEEEMLVFEGLVAEIRSLSGGGDLADKVRKSHMRCLTESAGVWNAAKYAVPPESIPAKAVVRGSLWFIPSMLSSFLLGLAFRWWCRAKAPVRP